MIDKHPTLSYKQVYYDERVMVAFYLIVKDEYGYECFDDFFITDLQGEQLSLSVEEMFEINKLI